MGLMEPYGALWSLMEALNGGLMEPCKARKNGVLLSRLGEKVARYLAKGFFGSVQALPKGPLRAL